MKKEKVQQSISREKENKFKIFRKIAVIFGIVALACVCVIAVLSFASKDKELKPRTLEELLALSDEDLGRVDIARMNLLCATGLPHAENVDVEKYLETLDQWAGVIQAAEKKYLPAFHRNPAKYENSLSKFKAIYMVLTTQEDLRCGYNMYLVNSGILYDYKSLRFHEDSRDSFLHGMIERRKGTCASIPVFAVALGRRCGYPLYLVRGKGHLFFRWDDGKERFNVEASTQGTDIHPDERYYAWPFPTSQAERTKEKFLKSLTPVEELSTFMFARGSCFHAHGRFKEAEEAYAVYLRGFPESQFIHGLIAEVRRKGRQE